ncbi:MAG: hypothetical protein E7389_02545 [Ruminococcaceae bacterium]|nr:hypothetical protein [Oscillospiraceae bacterium]
MKMIDNLFKKNKSFSTPVDKVKYSANGFISDDKIHLGTYYRNDFDMEQINLAFENNEWFLESFAMCPAQAGASNGGQSKTILDEEYFTYRNIYNLKDFLAETYRGNLHPCLEYIIKHEDALHFLTELIQTKTKPNYNVDGLALLWSLNKTRDGVVIHKCFSKEKKLLSIPAYIDSVPVVAFGHRAFNDMQCKALIIPDTLKELNGISGCQKLQDITIPVSARECCPFLECRSLKNIYVENGNSQFVSVDGILYNADKTKLIRCPQNRQGKLLISETVLCIENWACCDCYGLEQIVFPNKIIKIGIDAFKNCTGVQSFDLPDSIQEISWGAFANIQRERIKCSEHSYSYKKLNEVFSNPYWHNYDA